MKYLAIQVLAALLVCLSNRVAVAQGIYLYDQQSSDESNLGGAARDISIAQPTGQTFTPTLSMVGFIRLWLVDHTSANGIGTTMSLNLREGTIGGAFLSSSDTVVLANGFRGTVDFIFSTPVTVTPNSTYFFEPVILGGESFSCAAYNTFFYSGGTSYALGVPEVNLDLWFREGIIVPEPATWALWLVGGSALLCGRRLTRRN
jgi:hypothetical protein